MADVLNRATGGRLKVEVVPPNAIVPVSDIYKGVMQGAVDCSWHAFASGWTGLYPEAFMEVGMTYGWQDASEVWDAMIELGMQDIIQEANDQFGVWNVIASDTNLYTWFTNFEPTSPWTFKGKKLQAYGMSGEFVKALGASPTSLPATDRYMALKLGTIDGSNESFVDTIKNRKFQEVTKYVVTKPKSINPLGVIYLTNQKSLAALPEDIRRIVKEVVPLCAWTWAHSYATREAATAAEASKLGLKPVEWSDADTLKAIELAQTLWEDFGKKSPRCAKLLDILKKQLRDYGRLK